MEDRGGRCCCLYFGVGTAVSSTFISFPISLCEFDRTDCCRMKERELGTDMPGKYQSTARLGGTISTAWVADYYPESHKFVHKIL